MTAPARTDAGGTSTDICQALPSAHTVRTVEISEKLLCLFSAEVTEDGERYTVRVPRREVETGEIEDLGKQGDGIARVERGYVIIVPGAEVGEQVKIEVTEVKSNFAVAETVDEEF